MAIETVQIKRGLKANLPRLAEGELALTTDTNEIFLGTANGNIQALNPNLTTQVNTNTSNIQTNTTNIQTNTSQLADIAQDVKQAGADSTGAVDATTIFQNALNKGGTILIPYGNYKISSTLTVPTGTKIIGQFSTINFTGNNTTLFSIGAVSDIVFEDLVLQDTVGNNTAFAFTGTGTASYTNYARRITLKHVVANAFNLGIKATYARQWKLDQCLFTVNNGIAIYNTSVEININDSIIYGNGVASSYGILLDINSGNTSDFPQGIMISGCTLDQFANTIQCNAVYVFQVINSYIGSASIAGSQDVLFGYGNTTHNQDITFDNCVFYGNGLTFTPGKAVQYHAIFSNCIFESINGTNITLNNGAQAIQFDTIHFNAVSGAIGAILVTNNGDVQFSNIWFNSGFTSGIQVKGTSTGGISISDVIYQGSGDCLYLEQPVLLSNINGVTAQTLGYTYKYVNIPQGANATTATVASLTMSVAKGQKGVITLATHITAVTGSPILDISVPTGITIPNGGGWSAGFVPISGAQYVAVTIPFVATQDITNGVFGFSNSTGSTSVTYDYHSYLAIQLN